jgi:hypothetical protein
MFIIMDNLRSVVKGLSWASNNRTDVSISSMETTMVSKLSRSWLRKDLTTPHYHLIQSQVGTEPCETHSNMLMRSENPFPSLVEILIAGSVPCPPPTSCA